jgi:hypothetical protein
MPAKACQSLNNLTQAWPQVKKRNGIVQIP